jgi:hypothetical protein
MPTYSMYLNNLICTSVVLVGVGLFVLEELAEAIVPSSEQSTKEWADPIDPVGMVETSRCHTRTERTCWVQTTSGIVDT